MPRLRAMLSGLLMGAVLALSGPMHNATGWQWGPPLAWACGFGPSATMLANSEPALLNSIASQQGPNAPLGVFALNYAAAHPIIFTEDLSRVSGHPNPQAYSWSWDFGDQTRNTGRTVTHAYATPGSYTIRVSIRDVADQSQTPSDFDSARIQIDAQPVAHIPLARVTAQIMTVTTDQEAAFNGSASRAASGTPLTYTWNFGDGDTASGPRVSHRFTTPGVGQVALIVQDEQGARAVAYLLIRVTVAGAPPSPPQLAPSARAVPWLGLIGVGLLLFFLFGFMVSCRRHRHVA